MPQKKTLIVGVTLLVIAVLAAYLLFSCGKNARREKVAIVLAPKPSLKIISESVRSHTPSFKLVLVDSENEGRAVHSTICLILFKKEAALPIVVYLNGSKLAGVIVGDISEELWRRVCERLAMCGPPFLAYSGPEDVLLPAKCYHCPPLQRVEELVDLPPEKVDAILRAVLPLKR